MDVVLASASPRRERLLKKITRKFSVKTAKIDEKIGAGETFQKAAERLAVLKASAVADGKSVVIGADTIAYFGKRNFRKTKDGTTARRVLSYLRGKTHYVITGVAVIYPSGRCVKYSVKARVKMKEFTDDKLESYLKYGEWRGRAGCYDVSGKGRRLVASVRGEKETVVGLPLKRLKLILSTA